MKDCIAFIAVLLPVAACVLTGWRFCRQDKGSWQLAACFAALVIATSIVLLAASGRVSFVRYGEAVVQMDQKLEETRRLTEQNKRIAKATAELGLVLASPFAAPEVPEIWQESRKKLISLLREAGESDEQISQFLKDIDSRFPTNTVPPKK